MQELIAQYHHLSPQKRRLLVKLMEERGMDPVKLLPIARRADRERAPLSFAQERLWFVSQLNPQGWAYNMPIALRLQGTLDCERLEQAVNQLREHHAVLRTRFPIVNGHPLQFIEPYQPQALPILDLQEASAETRINQAHAQARHILEQPFDLAQEAPFRCHLLKLDSDDHVLLMTLHHILADGQSLDQLLTDLFGWYEGQDAPATDEAVDYADFSAWQREWFEGPRLKRQMDYWRAKLAGSQHHLDLPSDLPRPKNPSGRGAHVAQTLPNALAATIKDLANGHDASLFMTMLAAFQAFLARLTDQTDINVGTVISGRTKRETQSLVGLFLNTLVLRAQINRDQGFGALLDQVRDTVLEAFDHSDIPFENLVRELVPRRQLEQTPFFQVCFSMIQEPEEAPAANAEEPQLQAVPFDAGVEAAKFDLTLEVVERGSQITVVFQYSQELFQQTTMARMIDHFVTFLASATTTPQQPLAQLRLLSDSERGQLLTEWNQGAVAEPPAHNAIDLFNQIAATHGQAVAIRQGSVTLTYEALNQRARQWAHRLVESGVQPGRLVGICLDRSPEAIIAMVAILKAGGAFVSIDPNYPTERKRTIIEDADLALLMTRGDRLGMVADCPTVMVEEWIGEQESFSCDPVVAVSPDDPAYAIYTSGTTGKPKGVILAHRGVCNLAVAQQLAFGPQPGDRILQFASYSFDASVWELIMAFSSGATLVLPSQNTLLAGADLRAALSQGQISIATLPPSVLTGLSAEGLDHLHTLITAGERCSRELVDCWAPGRRFFNAYGPSETTVCASVHRCQPGQADPPIGRPIANTQLYILDAGFEPVPVGVVGELFIGGPSVGLGYRNNHQQTDRAFIENPFGDGRLYRTGDFASCREDGCVTFHGRRDHQVKLRGFRIELGEIEATLARHQSVSAAIATVIREGSDEGRLVAYVLHADDHQATGQTLRNFLQDQLPAHMVPHAVLAIDQVPMTHNGKIDYAALPKPGRSSNRDVPLVTPRNKLEQGLADIWQKHLAVDQLSIHDDFFALGGHSIMVTRVVADLQDTLGLSLNVRHFFENPTIAKLAETLSQRPEDGSAESTADIDDRLTHAIVRNSPRDRYPTTFAQQRFWFQQQLNPADTSFNVPTVLRIRGPLDVAALRQALSEVQAHHPILRTTFQEVDGLPYQVVHPTIDLNFRFLDLSEVPKTSATEQASLLVEAFTNTPFDLGTQPPMRSLLLRIDVETYVFAVLKHHIITDGWSTGLFHAELAARYNAAVTAGPALAVDDQQPHYGDFAIWQDTHFGGDALTRSLEYWEQHLADLGSLDLPTDRPLPAERFYQGASLPFALSHETSQALKELSRAQGVTLYMTLLAAFHNACQQLTGQHDFGIGTAYSGRDHGDSHAMLGAFINVLVIRIQSEPTWSIGKLLEETRTSVLGAFAHGQVPFEQLVNRLAPDRSPGSNPLYRVMFGLQNTPPTAAGPGYMNVQVEPFHTEVHSAQVDLSLDLFETEEGLVGALEYSTELFEERSVQTFLDLFSQIVASFVANPTASLRDVDPLSPTQRHWLLQEANHLRAEFPRETCLHQLFEAQVQRTPNAVAIRFQGESVTYDHLNRRANRVAHALIDRGVGPETIVPMMADRSPDYLATMIGIMKAGGVYLPLDPNYPDTRIQGILSRIHASWVIHQADYHGRLQGDQAQAGSRLLALESLFGEGSEENPELEHPEGALAYLLFTSGSTGQPKGVMLPHRGVVNHKCALIKLLNLQAEDVVAQTASQSFDISIWQLWTALLVGGTVAIVPQDIARDPQRLLALIRAEGITIAQLVPSFIDSMMAYATDRIEASGLGRLRIMIPTGEALSAETAKQWFGTYPHIPLINAYGPCECSDDVTTHLLRQAPRHSGAVAIGRSVQNVSVFLVRGEDLHLVPQGALGEIAIGGVGVGRGYFADPARTATVFVPDPFSAEPGSRMYRTGDIGRMNAASQFEFAGRKDHQVKIRGYRIELGEVESALLSLPEVGQVVVKPDGVGADQQRLAAWVVPATEQTLTATAIHGALKGRLPQYMLPSMYTFLESLPTLPNGKLDRRSLTVDDRAETVSGPAYVAPRNEIERALSELWSDILGLKRVGIEDHFFEIGGHSLLATRVISRIRLQFEVDLPVMALFTEPTIAALAQRIGQANRGEAEPTMPPLEVKPRPDRIPLSFTQERLWFFSKLDPESAAYNIPYAYRIRQALDEDAFQRAVRALCERHEILRTSFTDQHGDLEQKVLPTPNIQWHREDWSQAPDTEKDQIALELAAKEAARPFNLSEDALFRVGLIDFGPEDWVLLFNFHHIVFDGWSSDLFFGELTALYEGFQQDTTPQLADLPVQFADVAIWQREAQEAGYLDRQADYWKGQLEGVSTQPFLPTDFPRPALQTFNGDDHEFVLPSALARSLRDMARAERVTVFMTLLAGFYAFLYRYSGQQDLCVGTPIAGRNRAETESLIGPFINTLALRQVVQPKHHFRELLQQVRAMTVAAYDHQDLPFERLLNELAIERDLSSSPLFQIMFSMQADRGGDQTGETSQPDWQPLSCDLKIAKFDITVQFAEAGDDLVGIVEYNTDLFQAAMIGVMVERFIQVLTQVVEAPILALADYPCILPRETEMLAGINATDTELPPGNMLSRLAETAMRRPNHVAVSHCDRQWTYQALHQAANGLAHQLRRRGITQETAVGVLMPRCLELPMSMLAVWKAGGAYVPIDSSTPPGRLQHLVEDTQMPVLLSVSALESAIPESLQSRVCYVDRLQVSADPECRDWEAPVDPQQTAYILFTSGSTGRPKGVRIPQQAVFNHMCWMTERFPMDHTDKVLQKTPIGFDASVWEFWMPLLTGAQLVMGGPEVHRDPNQLAETLHTEAVTWLQMVPSMLQFLVEETHFQAATSLKYLFCGGERLHPQLVARCNQVQNATLINLYGPTETCIDATYEVCERTTDPTKIGIGHPIHNMQAYVLDADGQQRPPGLAGELMLAGSGLAAGYHRRPSLTAASFVPNPFAKEPGQRMYRTGDRVRYTVDSRLEFLDRRDNQVKLRGLRIELAEIESLLNSHPTVTAAVVKIITDAVGDQRLTAYITAARDSEPAEDQLTTYLHTHLPGYMVPGQFLFMTDFPKTSSGKVDRKALPDPPQLEVNPSHSETGTATPLQASLLDIWSEVLGHSVGLTQKFFEAGGDSLKILKVQNQIRQKLEVELSVVDLFQYNTIESLATFLHDKNPGQQATDDSPENLEIFEF